MMTRAGTIALLLLCTFAATHASAAVFADRGALKPSRTFSVNAPAPIVDGDITDLQAYAAGLIADGTGCGIIINDPVKDVCLSDPLIVPCTANLQSCLASGGQYYVNGFDQVLAVAAVKGNDSWFGVRVNGGQIGDSDGDGTDAVGSNCPPPGLGQNPEDGPGIAEGERYIFRLDTNCDGLTDVRISAQGGAGTHVPTVIVTDGAGSPIPGVTGQAQYGTSDLEIHVSGLNLPAVFSMNTFVGSDFDGLSEDAAGPVTCNAPVISLDVQKTADKPTICPGDKDRFTVSVTNTSLVTFTANLRDVLPQGWTYSNNVSGDFAFASQNGQVVSFAPLDIPAGQTRSVSFDATSPSDCLGPYENKAVADAAYNSPCLKEPDTALSDTARTTVTCESKPCVTNVHCSAPEAACNGDQIDLSAFATNCGDRPADIVFTFLGHDHIVNNVAPGAEARFDTTIAFSCTPGEPGQFNVSAVARNSCGTSAPGSSSCSTQCKTPPCVSNVSCSVPASACDGEPVTLKGFATNCGDRTEEIVITLSGPGGTIGSHAFNVAAGAQAEFDTTITFHCTGGQTSNFGASAVARNECGVTQPATSAGCSILCKTQPCVNNVSCSVPASACSNTQIQLKGFATNCDSRAGEIVITLSGPAGVIGSHAFNVAAGAQAEFDTTITLVCTPGEGTTFHASAIARNDCGETQPVTSDGCTVQCLSGPCVDQVSCSTSASALCDGQPLKLTGNAHNCSDRAEQIVITLLGPNDVVLAARAFNVAAGASVSYDTTFTFNCTGSETKNYKASAVATNDCGTTDAVASSGCPVTCKSQPCVNNVHCSVPASACDGDQVTIKGFATNCDTRAGEIVITLSGPAGVLGSHAFNVAAGAVAEFDTTITFHCTGGQSTNYNVSAIARNDCGETQPVSGEGCSILCKTQPCVSDVHCATPASACDGDQVKISGFAKNCDTRDGQIVITLSGPAGVLGSHEFNVAAGAEAEFDTTITFHCTGGQTSSFSVSAVAKNDCGQTQPVSGGEPCTILCKTPPCVNNVHCEAPASACDNTSILLKGFATNCGDRSEEIVITLKGPGGSTIGSHAFNVAAGQAAEFDTTITFDCTPGEGSAFTASAIARNDCGETQAVTSDGCTVQCLNGPCVDQVSCSTSASALCDGSPLKLTGNAHNCSDRTEQIVITLLGPNDVVLASRAFNVAAGASVSYDTTFTFNCTGTESKTYKASAVASNDCGTTGAVASSGCPVTCKTQPCVSNVSCEVPATACDGSPITLKGFATNCDTQAGEIVITLLGPNDVVIGSHAFNVAAGAAAEFDTSITLHCTAGSGVAYKARAYARNDCGQSEAQTSSGCTVQCAPGPCVTIQCAPGDTTVQIGDTYSVRATATNCSTGVEDIVITLNGQQYPFPGVPAGESRTVVLDGQKCDAAGAATYNASATATNSCGTTQPVTCQSKVTCQGTCCWLTMGGFLNANMRSGNKDNTFGGNVGPPPSGSWEHIQRNGKDEVFNFHSHDAHVIQCYNDGNAGPCHPAGDNNVIVFGGTGAYSLNGGKREFPATFEARAEDHGEPGRQGNQKGGCGTPDYYTITVKDAGTGEVVFTAAGYLDGGNIQIHPCHGNQVSSGQRQGASSGLGLAATGAGDQAVSVEGAGSTPTLELYRPTPNPFSNTTSFAYQVSGSAAQRVQIGIYDVAGRLIRELVDESKGPGQYQTVWNGQDQGGSQVVHGVYFIRAYVGGIRVDTASRILYLR